MDEMGKVDTHLHTNYSGFQMFGPLRFPESVCTPETQVDAARKRGLDVLCVTDHNEVAGAFIAQKYARKYGDIDIVIGDEVMTDRGEIIGLWLNEKVPKFLTPEEAVENIHEQGGVCIAPHPFSMHVDGLQEKIFELPIEGFETINGGHPDNYANWFAQQVMERYPGRWAALSGSDAHSIYTAGFNWTEFPGNSEEDFRKAILDKKTVPMGVPAPVLGQVQWSLDVVLGGQKLLWKALRHKLEKVPDNKLINTVVDIPDIKKIIGIFGGAAYAFPPITILGTLLSLMFLKKNSRRLHEEADDRLDRISRIIERLDGAPVDGRTCRSGGRGPRDRGRCARGSSGSGHGCCGRGDGTGLSRIPQIVPLSSHKVHMDAHRGVASVLGGDRKNIRRRRMASGVRRP